LDVELLPAAELRRRYRGHIVSDQDVGVLDHQAGILNPEAAVTAMLDQVREVKRNTRVSSVEELIRGFDSVVVAAGPWTPELVDWIPLRVERQVHVWFSIARDADWFTPDRWPVFIRQSREFGYLYGVPSLDGATVKLGRHHDGDFTDPDHIKRRVDE